MIQNLKTAGHNISEGFTWFILATAFTIVASKVIIFSEKHEKSKLFALWIILVLLYIHIYFSFFEGLLNSRRIEEIQ